ncbi:hypothetical protein L1606_30535 [Streptomyces spororaveus]|nr:hypothetical protein [Streptomyces spororaveus]MCM9082371.1 hypothetical protein [Streptomyces spororaveus]
MSTSTSASCSATTVRVAETPSSRGIRALFEKGRLSQQGHTLMREAPIYA